jgi:hypothetical protein
MIKKKVSRKERRLKRMADIAATLKKAKLKVPSTVAGLLNRASRRTDLRFTIKDLQILSGKCVGTVDVGPLYWFSCDKSFGALLLDGRFAVPRHKGKRCF